MNRSEILAILEDQMNLLKSRLLNTINIIDGGYRINSGAWVNDSGFCVAFLSCIKYPHEEAIDLTLDVTYTERKILITKGIYWSEGSIIQDFGTVEIPWKNTQHTKIALEKVFKEISKKELKAYSDFILQHKNESNYTQ